MHSYGLLATAATALLASSAMAHMEMSKPYAIRSKFDPANKSGGNIDYSMTAPLEASGANYPCKGYHTDPDLRVVASYKAGSTYSMEVAGSAVHNGGSCQLSLSYDGGKTFRVIKSMIGGCPLTKSYEFTIPPFAPNGTALLGWTWQNHSGNREFYMNCAVVDVESSAGAPSSKARRDAAKARREMAGSFDQLPTIWKANMPQVGPCKTQEGSDPVYPHPGSDIVYGSGKSSADAPDSQEGCDSSSSSGSSSGGLDVSEHGQDGGASQSSSAISGASTLLPSPVATASFASTTAIRAVADPTQRPTASSSSTPTLTDAGSVVPSASASPAPGQTTGELPSPAGGGGSCSSPGAFQCTLGGQGFAVCDHGKWVDMGAVAAGTVCHQGQIVVATNATPSHI